MLQLFIFRVTFWKFAVSITVGVSCSVPVSSSVSGHTYDYIVKLVRQHGVYPLNLGEYDLDVAADAGAIP